MAEEQDRPRGRTAAERKADEARSEEREHAARGHRPGEHEHDVPEGPAGPGHPGWEKALPEEDERSEEERQRDVERVHREAAPGYSPTAQLGPRD